MTTAFRCTKLARGMTEGSLLRTTDFMESILRELSK